MRIRLLLLACFLLVPLAAWAQSGKITGTVLDRETGEPLPGATVVIDGTQRGTASDIDGEYVLLNVDPGVYTLHASFVGYGTQIVQEVTVNSDFTTIVDFQLGAGVELDEVVVQGQRLIQQDEVSTTTIIRGEDIQELPVNGFSDAVTLAAGVVDQGDGSQPNVRGGRSLEVAYIVDGVLVEDPLDGTIGGFDVARQSIDELQIMTGGFSAKYGEAMSGIILINTPTGGNDFHGSVRFSTDGFSLDGLGQGGPTATPGDRLVLVEDDDGTQRYELRDLEYERPFSNDWGTRKAEISLSGPIIQDRLTFFVNADRLDTDTHRNAFEGPERPAVFPWSTMVGYEYYQAMPNTFVDANGRAVTDLPEAVELLEEGDVITQDIIDQLANAGVDVDRLGQVAVRNYQMRHSLGLFNDLTRLTANLGINISQDMDARVGYKLTRNDWRGYDHQYKYLPQYNNQFERNIDIFSAQFTHRVTPTLFYELRASYTDNEYFRYLYDEMKDADDPQRFYRVFYPGSGVVGAFNTDGLSDADGGSNYDFLGYTNIELYLDYPFFLSADLDDPLMLSRDVDVDGDGMANYVRGQRVTEEILAQIEGLQNLSTDSLSALGLNKGTVPVQAPPTDREYVERKIKDYQFSADVTAQLNDRNLLSIGAKYRQLDLLQYDVFPNGNWDGATPLTSFTDGKTWNAYEEVYVEAQPFEFAAYVEDKIEFSNLVLRPGLRVDVLDSDMGSVVGYSSGGRLQRPSGPDAEPLEEVDSKTKVRVSPRFGVAFPITDRARLSFNYGQFMQYPEYNRMYEGYRSASWIPGQGYMDEQFFGFDMGGFETFVGNPDIDPEHTIFYQFDADFLITENFKLGAALFYKDIFDYIAYTRQLGDGGEYYWYLDNLDYANARGFEIRAEKRLEQYLGFSASYTYSRAIGNASEHDDGYDDWYNNSVTGILPPKNARPLDWDQPHTLNVTVNGQYQGISANLIGRFGSGLPYTPTSSRGTPLGPRNSARLPWTGMVDARLAYTYEAGRATVRPFLEVTNLLDRENVNTVFTTTGAPNFSLDQGTQFEDAQRMNYYLPPRHFEFGVQLSF